MERIKDANLILVRHGESIWNRENRFTGWSDVDLTEQGIQEAHAAGKILSRYQIEFDVAHTSVLKRAIHTLWLILKETDLMWIPVVRNWRLNERHYGALQGMNKQQTANVYGAEQVHLWRRSYTVVPPALDSDDRRHPKFDRRYADLDPHLLPAAESLENTNARFLPFWQDRIAVKLRAGKKVLVVLHGNSMRGSVKTLEGIRDDDISHVEIPTGRPYVYTLDKDLNLVSKQVLD